MLKVQPKKVARVELPPMPPAEAKKFLIEAIFSYSDMLLLLCSDADFRCCTAVKLLVIVCAV